MLPDRICVVGLGRVGLPTAALLASAGLRVVGCDPRLAGAAELDPGPEPGLRALLGRVALAIAPSPVPAEAYVVCVGTPLTEERTADLRALEAAVGAVDAVAPDGALVVIESTVPVGTTDDLAERLPRLRLAVAPERVLPGDALREIVENPRLVGGDPAAAELYRAFVTGTVTLVDRRTAELAKLVENAARDVEIALANTAAQLAREHGVDPRALRALVNQHPRVALREPGIGVGGHCLPVDPWFLGPKPLLAAARRVNDAVPAAAVARIKRERGTIALLGLAYKPDTDDLRGSPALEIARALGADRDVVAHDPHVVDVPGVRTVPLDAALHRDVVVRLVAHREYRDLSGITLDLVGGWS